MRTKLALVVAGIALLTAVRPVIGHHSFAAEFDATKKFNFAGPVTKVEWMNPHTYFYMDVKDEQTGKERDHHSHIASCFQDDPFSGPRTFSSPYLRSLASMVERAMPRRRAACRRFPRVNSRVRAI